MQQHFESEWADLVLLKTTVVEELARTRVLRRSPILDQSPVPTPHVLCCCSPPPVPVNDGDKDVPLDQPLEIQSHAAAFPSTRRPSYSQGTTEHAGLSNHGQRLFADGVCAPSNSVLARSDQAFGVLAMAYVPQILADRPSFVCVPPAAD